MKLTGWILMVVFGGTWLFFVVQWAYRWLTDYYVDPEQWTALAWLGVYGVAAAIPVGIGVILVYRASRQDFPNIDRD